MSLNDHVKALKGIANDAKRLFAELKTLAEASKNATEAQKSKIKSLGERLRKSASAGVRERRKAEIKQLDGAIEALDTSLSIQGLSASTRDAIKATLLARRARRARLLAQEGMDFGGVLTQPQVDKLDELTKKVKADSAKKKLASAFLEGVVKITDTALTIAGKIAM